MHLQIFIALIPTTMVFLGNLSFPDHQTHKDIQKILAPFAKLFYWGHIIYALNKEMTTQAACFSRAFHSGR